MPSAHADAFSLDSDVTYLNHGSFGACPKVVRAAQLAIMDEMERQPVRFFMRRLPELLERARTCVAELVGADALDIAFVRNATEGVNAVASSLRLAPGDEVLTTNHGYPACKNALRHHAERAGAKLVVATLPFPVADEAEVESAVLSCLSERTRLLMIDHVTSPTALVLPVERIVSAAEARGIPTLVDGAHAPGMLPLNLRALGASYYTGNFHKWLCAPKAAGFLFVRRDRQEGLHPAVISHGYSSTRPRSKLWEEFDWCGTGDFSATLCVPEALEFLRAQLGSVEALMERNHALAVEGRKLLLHTLSLEPPAPEHMLGSMATVSLPWPAPPPGSVFELDPLQTELLERFSIEVPIFAFPAPGQRCLRVSAQLYNDAQDYERLAGALRQLGTVRH